MKTRLVMALILFFPHTEEAQTPWVPIKAARRNYHLTTSQVARPRVYLMITSVAGVPSYRIRCGSFDSPIDDQFDFSGDFECQLQSIPAGKRYSTLFTENPKSEKDWDSRARFITPELVAPCDRIPDFGRVRSFRLRGMMIRLALSNITFTEERGTLRMATFDFDVGVEPDAAAVGTIAESPVIDPKWKNLPCQISHSVPVHFR